jgi:hypothetical protein
MIIITHDYGIINRPEMTDSFIVRPDKVKRVWDITEGKVGIEFVTSYDAFKYEITLERDDKTYLAKDFLDMLTTDNESIIEGSVKVK